MSTVTVIFMASKMSRACDISPKVRKEVIDRDRVCIICGRYSGLQVAHYISRARGGLGTAKNLGLMCVECHGQYDNSHRHKEIKTMFEEYLKSHYEDWNEDDLIYRKWR